MTPRVGETTRCVAAGHVVTSCLGLANTGDSEKFIRKFLAAMTLGAVIAVSPALAGTKTLKLDTGDFLAALGGSVAGGFLELPDVGGLGGIAYYMPEDHRKDKPAIFRLTLSSACCSVWRCRR